MNPDSLCARCEHLIRSLVPGARWHYCKHRNSMQQRYEGVVIDKGFKTCSNFKPKQNHHA